MALQGAAGVAMHLGAGEQALTLAEQVIERNESTGTMQGEAYVLLALAQCQVGRFDEALATIEQIPVDDFPFGLATRALVRAVAGEVEGALDDAEAVEITHGASYFDLALARLAGVLAAAASATTSPAGAGSISSARWRPPSVTSCSWPWPSCSTTARSCRRRRANPLAPGWRRIVDSVVVG